MHGKRQLLISAILTVISLVSLQQVIQFDSIRSVDLILLYSSGMISGIFLLLLISLKNAK